MSNFVESLKKRRSIYHLGDQLSQTPEEISALVKAVVKESPTAFNSQSQRVVILFSDAHRKLWRLTETLLEPLTPKENFANTQAKLQGFSKGAGTILFFEDQEVVTSLQNQFALYADNFPIWSEQASGLTQANVWSALAQENIGANLQHYNPVIDQEVAKEWALPEHWKLRAQLVFGSIESPAASKEYVDDDTRFRVFQ